MKRPSFIRLPVVVIGDGSGAWLSDAKGKALVHTTQVDSDDDHVQLLHWLANLINSTNSEP